MAKQVPLDATASQIEADATREVVKAVAQHEVDKHEIGESQSERFKRMARELGLDEREETFDAALEKVARHKHLSGGTGE